MSLTLRRALATMAVAALALPSAAAAKRDDRPAFGVTSLEVTAPLGALGLGAAPIGPAQAYGATFAFGITTNFGQAKKSGRINHSGGIELSGGGQVLRLRDFQIRLDKGDLTAALDSGVRVPIVTLEVPKGTRLVKAPVGPVVARLTSTAAGALTATFGAPDLTGFQLGLATIDFRGG